jgi:DNA-binding NarL/FixJ family response regulator
MDLHIPGNSGLSGVASIKKLKEDCQLVVISATESPMIVYRTIKLGAGAFIPKTSEESQFKVALADIFTGKSWIPKVLKTRHGSPLTQPDTTAKKCDARDCLSEKIASLSPRQYKVLEMISDGQLNKQIAYSLELCEGTVKHHVSLILQKLNVINRTAAANMFNRLKVEKRLNILALE